MVYVDGAVVPVATAKRDEYLAFARMAAEIFKDHGATRVVEGWGDDVPDGEVTSMPMAVKARADETVVWSWIEWPSKAARDAGWEKVQADPRMTESDPMPFDGKRMIFGGFDMILET